MTPRVWLLWSLILASDAFLPSFRARRHSSPLLESIGSVDDDDRDENGYTAAMSLQMPPSAQFSRGKWRLTNDFETFLNQCSIQSFLFLLRFLKDTRTVEWLEDFTQPVIPFLPSDTKENKASRLLRYHGLAALNTTLFPTWDSYFSLLLAQEPVSETIESPNPYTPSYEHEIKPASLSSRLLSVRAQIALEFTKDLEAIAAMDGTHAARDFDTMRHTSSGNLFFLNYHPDETSDYHPSPLRKGNFDLLKLLTTQEAIHRCLEHSDSRFWHTFYAERLDSHFRGPQKYGRADDVLRELMEASPSVQVSDNQATLIDPSQLAAELLEKRSQVATEWRKIVSTMGERHMEIQRLQLNVLMGRTTEEGASGVFE